MAATERVLIVGYGYAGQRFSAAIEHLRRHGAPVGIAGYCDLDPSRLPREKPGFADLRIALGELSPTVVCVTVNEAAHDTVFSVLGSHRRSLILSEKPLTTNLDEARRAKRTLRHHAFSMNLVERFSPIVSECRAWIDAEGPFEVVRVESFWGKHRLGDPRPTMGVLSELIHPLDLLRHLFPPGQLTVMGTNALASDFSPHGTEILETLDVNALSGETPVLLHTSFSWPGRMRRVTALLWSPVKGMFRADLTFDTPHWDCDALEIFSISTSGRYHRVHEWRLSHDDVPSDIRGIAKVVRFIDESVRTWRGEEPSPRLVDLDEAIRLQESLHDIECSARFTLITASYRKVSL